MSDKPKIKKNKETGHWIAYMDKNNKVYSAVSDSMKGAVRDFYSKYSKELNLKYGKG